MARPKPWTSRRFDLVASPKGSCWKGNTGTGIFGNRGKKERGKTAEEFSTPQSLFKPYDSDSGKADSVSKGVLLLYDILPTLHEACLFSQKLDL